MRLLRHDACPAAGGNEAWYRYHGARRARLLSVGDVAEGERRAMADLDFLERQIPLARSSHILEIGCAWGRHTTELLRRGYTSVVSVDIDPAMLARAHRRLADARLAPDLREASFMDITRAEGPFDAVLQLYDRSVLGFPTEDEDRASLHHVAGLLRPGGHLLFGIRDWPLDLPHAARSWQETAEGLELDEVVADPVTMTCTAAGSPVTRATVSPTLSRLWNSSDSFCRCENNSAPRSNVARLEKLTAPEPLPAAR